jgi:hypothetical protein
MQVLTPSGYQDPVMLADGAELCAFDLATGAPILNTIENIDYVGHNEWCRWWSVEDTVPPFNWYRINGSDNLLFREQSIWRNGTNVCHVRDLVVGDVIHDDKDADLVITSIECVEDRELIWYRFKISGDHSYITDGITVHNASRFWVGGTGTWNSSSTTPWAASTGGAGGQSVPGSGDDVTLDGASGGGTVTLNFGGTVTINSLTMGAFTGTFDNSVNNNNFSLASSTSVINGAGSATRTYKMGSATYTLTNNAATVSLQTVTNLTYQGSNCTFAFTGSTAQRALNLTTGITYGTISIGASSGAGNFLFNGTGTITALLVTAPNVLQVGFFGTLTINNAFALNGTSAGAIIYWSGQSSTLNCAAGSTMTWAAIYGFAFTGSPVATNSFNLLNNSGITITPPSTGGGLKYNNDMGGNLG